MVFTAVGGWLGYFLGGYDGLLYALVVFMVVDYITGVMCAVSDKKLSSAVGFKGICRKVLILMLVPFMCFMAQRRYIPQQMAGMGSQTLLK